MLLLIGANGRTDRAVLKSLCSAGISVRALIRNKSQAANLINLGAAEYAVGDLTEPTSLNEAFRGIRSLFHIGPPMHPDEVSITRSLIDLATSHAIDQFTYYSVLHPLLRGVRHHRLKLDAEEHLICSGLPYVIVQPSGYMQHLEAIWRNVTERGVHEMPFSIEQKFNVVNLAHVAKACAVRASDRAFRFGTFELAGAEALSQLEMAHIIEKILRRPVIARALPWDEMRSRARSAGASDDRIEQMETMDRHYDSHGFRGNSEVLRFLLNRAPTSFSGYVEQLASRSGSAAQ